MKSCCGGWTGEVGAWWTPGSNCESNFCCRRSSSRETRGSRAARAARADSKESQETVSFSSNTRTVAPLLSQVLCYRLKPLQRRGTAFCWSGFGCAFSTCWGTALAAGLQTARSRRREDIEPHFSHCTKQNCGTLWPGRRQEAPHCRGLGTSKFQSCSGVLYKSGRTNPSLLEQVNLIYQVSASRLKSNLFSLKMWRTHVCLDIWVGSYFIT